MISIIPDDLRGVLPLALGLEPSGERKPFICMYTYIYTHIHIYIYVYIYI